jgi:hypothetical protein
VVSLTVANDADDVTLQVLQVGHLLRRQVIERGDIEPEIFREAERKAGVLEGPDEAERLRGNDEAARECDQSVKRFSQSLPLSDRP